MRNSDLSPLCRSAIRLDRSFNHLENNQSQGNGGYLPYNVELVGENHYRIAITVVGFTESELEITVQDNLLVVKGAHADKQEERTYLHQGIAECNFEHKFQLAENIHVRGTNLVNGLLYVDLERVIPEVKKPHRTEINQFPKAAWRGLTLPCSSSRSICESSDLQVPTRFSEGEMTMCNFDPSPLMRQWIGFDKLANVLQNTGESQSFPPYNIEKNDDNHYHVTLALVGSRQEDLEIQLEGTRLSAKGTPEQPREERKWLHQGLMNQPFSLSLTLTENMEVPGATFVNGLLYTDLIRNESESIAAQRVAISERPALNS